MNYIFGRKNSRENSSINFKHLKFLLKKIEIKRGMNQCIMNEDGNRKRNKRILSKRLRKIMKARKKC